MTLVRVITILLFCAPIAERAMASTCEPMSPTNAAEHAKVAFVGTVLQVDRDPYRPRHLCWDESHGSHCGGKRVTFAVVEALRGDVDERVELVSEDACYCLGSYWDVGDSYLVIARLEGEEASERLVAGDVCTGTGKLDQRENYLEALRD
ncbi:hypothetical protein [Aquimonas sp.]|uniref:hypothetical protein n=1 Tax=Aquimonas sp. TaxID=1872588 RepID=UPI0037C0E9EB